jgi:hypothetical protein
MPPSWKRLVPASLIALAAVSSPAVAAAQSDDAQRLFKEGAELMKQERLKEAEAKLQASWDLYKTYDTAANLAECEAKVGQLAEAAEHMSYAATHLPNHVSDQLRTEIKKRAGELRAEVGTLAIVVTADGADVTVGGRAVGQSPLPGDVFVDAGEVQIEARSKDGAAATTRVTVMKGEKKDVRLELQGTAAPPPPAPPPDEKGGSSPVPVVLLIAGGGLAVVGLGLGITGLVVASGKSSDADDQLAAIADRGQPCPGAEGCEELRATLGDQSTFEDLATFGFIGMGVGVATAAVGLILMASDGGEEPSALAPAPAPVGADLGGSLRLRF